MASLIATETTTVPPHQNPDYDCEASVSPSQPEAGKTERSRGQKSTIFWLTFAAFVIAGLVGFFLVGPLVKNAMVDSEAKHQGHTMGKLIHQLRPTWRVRGPMPTDRFPISDIIPRMSNLAAIKSLEGDISKLAKDGVDPREAALKAEFLGSLIEKLGEDAKPQLRPNLLELPKHLKLGAEMR